MRPIARSCGLFLFAGGVIFAQFADREHPRGFTLYERFEGSASQLGVITKLDTTVGYQFNPHFSVAAGIPVFFVRPDASVATLGTKAANGIGNVYGQARLTATMPEVSIASTLTVTAPTGDKDIGFSTGRATVDWSNYFERSIGRITPFGEIGIANAVSDTYFFVRPYVTQGFVAHFQGGARVQLARGLQAGGSAYAIAPSGEQTVVSRVVPVRQTGKGRGVNRVFDRANLTTGPPDLSRDHGLSVWFKVSATSTLDFYGGYTRSTRFALDSVFFGVGVSLGKVVRNRGV